MDIYILRIELIRYKIALRHTAFNIIEEIHTWFSRYKKCDQRTRTDERPLAYFLCEFFNALKAACFVLSHRIGRFFLYLVRGPPITRF